MFVWICTEAAVTQQHEFSKALLFWLEWQIYIKHIGWLLGMDAVRQIDKRFRHVAKGQGNVEREGAEEMELEGQKRLARAVDQGGSEPGSMNI